MGKHHLLGPSSANRWTACVGSLFGPPVNEDAGSAAKEGTACHALAELCLQFDDSPANWLGSTAFDPEGKIAVNAEMVAAVEQYTDVISSLIVEFGVYKRNFMLEKHIVHSAIPNDWFGGTCDCLMVGEKDGVSTLIVVDLKYGRKRVDPASLQLTSYALLALATLNRTFDRVVQVVFQPRANPPVSRYEPGTDDLAAAWQQISEAASFLEQHKAELESQLLVPANSRKAGSHCQYCRRRDSCVEYHSANTQLISQATWDHPTEVGRKLPMPVQELTVEQLVQIDQAADVVRQYLADVHNRLKSKAQQGTPIPGYKLILAWSHRKWHLNGLLVEDEESLLKVMPRQLGLTVDDVTERKLKSPAQVEKVLKAAKKLADTQAVLDKYAVKKPSGTKLVHPSARGEEIRPETAREFLAAIEHEFEGESDE